MLPTYPPKPHPEAASLHAEADLAFRQALALCPYSPEALSDYVNWLLPSAGQDLAPFRNVRELLESVPVIAEVFQQHSNRVDEARLFLETMLKLDPQNTKAQELLKTLQVYKSQQGQVGEATNNLAHVEKQVRASTLTAAQAQALARRLANEKAQELYHCQPFKDGPPAQWVQGYWVWHDGRAQGTLDIEATVKFAADGTSPDVNVTLLDSRLSPR